MSNLTPLFMDNIKNILAQANVFSEDQLNEIEEKLDYALNDDEIKCKKADKQQTNMLQITRESKMFSKEKNILKPIGSYDQVEYESGYKHYKKKYDSEYLIYTTNNVETINNFSKEEIYILFRSRDEPSMQYDKIICYNLVIVYIPKKYNKSSCKVKGLKLEV
ncbi:MAG: hypothetical protein RR922_03010 [Clostridia bacterium]